MEKITVFALDDDPGDLELLRRLFQEITDWQVDFHGYTAWHEAQNEIFHLNIDISLIDYLLGAITGLDVIKEIRKAENSKPIIILTGQGDENIAAKVIRAGADDYLVKRDLTADMLRRSISNALAQFRLRQEKAIIAKNLKEAQKMEAIGTLASGIAHDFNNMLTATLGLVDFSLVKCKGQEIEEDLQQVRKISQQMTELVKRLLVFSRRGTSNNSLIDLNQVIDETSTVLKYSLPANVNLQLAKGDFPLLLIGNSPILQQILLNLTINAADAMANGGIVTIKSSKVVLDDNSNIIQDSTLLEGEYILLEVIDSGGGIAAHNKDRIFEPYFSTKQRSSNRGSGLGLAIVWQNVKACNGYIDVQSRVGNGTTFRVYFPLASDRRLNNSSSINDRKNLQG